MIPAKELYDAIAALVAADADIGVDAKVVPIIAPFVPGVGLVHADLTYGTGDLAPLTSADAPSEGFDPLTGQWKILLDAPVGGWTWIPAGVTPVLPVTIYGFALVNNANTLLLATTALDAPIIITVPATILEFKDANLLMLIPPFI